MMTCEHCGRPFEGSEAHSSEFSGQEPPGSSADEVELAFRDLTPGERRLIIDGITQPMAEALLKVVPPAMRDLVRRAGAAGPEMVAEERQPQAAPQRTQNRLMEAAYR